MNTEGGGGGAPASLAARPFQPLNRLTQASLAARLFQPLDRLTQPAVYEEATRPVQQARIAVEVLRGALGGPAPAALDQRCRGLAYETLLLDLGTTYAELRLARLAEPEVRQSLAGRLGLELRPVRPDRLDEITVSPDQITDAQLEQMFGYRSTAPADPLQPPTSIAGVLLSRQAALRSAWLRADEADRDGPDGPVPVIDPDVIGERYLRSASPLDPARALWTQRRDWLAARLAEVNARIVAAGPTTAGLDAVVQEFVGDIDLPGLAARDDEGDDVSGDLAPFALELDAFLYLVTVRSLLAAGTLLDSEWQDVAAIVVQVRKRREYPQWRLDERGAGVILEPATFVLDVPGTDVLGWRFDRSTLAEWRVTLAARIREADVAEARFHAAVASAERRALPELRDALMEEIGRRQTPAESPAQGTERLSRELCIDLQAAAGQLTDRVSQAIDSVQSLLVSARSGRFSGQSGGSSLAIGDEVSFDLEWEWLVSYPRWRSAMRAFAYPENQLQPNLYETEFVTATIQLAPTQAYRGLMAGLAQLRRLTPDGARGMAAAFVSALRAEVGSAVPAMAVPAMELTDRRTNAALTAHRTLCLDLVAAASTPTNTITKEQQIPQFIRELFWLVPVALARKLQDSREYAVALDWYQTVFAYQWPLAARAIYLGLVFEGATESDYNRFPGWLAQVKELNPHFTARKRNAAYTRFTVMSIVECLLAYADSEFARSATDANARARALYQTAVDLVGLPEVAPETGPAVPFPANPVWSSLRAEAEAGLSKIHAGLNIGGFADPAAQADADSFLPSPYRYGVLVERARNLVAVAQQVEASYLAALERTDAENYGLLQAGHDLRVAEASLSIHDLKVTDAGIGVRVATIQRDKSQELSAALGKRLGLNSWERLQLDGLRSARWLQEQAEIASRFSGVFSAVGGIMSGDMLAHFGALSSYLSGQAGLAAQDARIAEVRAGFERRGEEWVLQRSQADRDTEIGNQQILLAQNQRQLAVQERNLAGLQRDHAQAVVEFLATKFTNAELHQWMSGVLGRVYAYFLQQATALAQLAQAQLAFERQEPAVGFVAADYWQDVAGTGGDTDPAADRRGLTGSARLLQDIDRLDQYAFQTDRRKLHLTQTLSLSQLAGYELQEFRRTGVLTFATPEELFDRDFPGHYLRLVKRVKVSLIALLPPVRGVRATLSALGVSRTVVARGPFDTVTLRREPESIAFTAPLGATGLFELEPDNGMLLPFEGTGVDTVWQLELPKAANPFDFNAIADVLLTIEYTALDSQEYRQKVVRGLNRRFTGDRTFSLRNQFPDAWYELSNPDAVEDAAARMRAVLRLTDDDLPPHVDDIAIGQLTLFAVRKDTFADELVISSLTQTAGGQSVAAAEVTTTGGVVSTRRPGGAAWQVFTGRAPAGDWEMRLPDNALVRSWFADGLIEDLVLVMTLSGTTPNWL